MKEEYDYGRHWVDSDPVWVNLAILRIVCFFRVRWIKMRYYWKIRKLSIIRQLLRLCYWLDYATMKEITKGREF